MKWRNQRSTVKGLAAGAVGGLVASWIMGYVHSGLQKWAEGGPEEPGQAEPEPPQEQRHPNRAERRSQARRMHQEQAQQPQGSEEQANVKAAVAVAENVFDHPLEPEQKQVAGTAVHYAFGSVMGGLYGMAAEQWDFPRWGEGSLFGAALWFGSDEIAVPVLKLSGPPQQYELKTHAAALASHLVYGVTTELVRRAFRAGVLAR